MHLDHFLYRRYTDAFIDGELDKDLWSRVGEHVAVCGMCGRDAEVTIHMKHSLACQRRFPERSCPGSAAGFHSTIRPISALET